MVHSRSVFPLVVILACFAPCGAALADGVHIPPLVYQVPAKIPQQRALIAFRDGRETLIIESAFETEAKEVGWIIPLPAVPDNILPVSSGAMKTISFRLQPEITHELSYRAMAWCGLAAVVLFYSYFLAVPFGARKDLRYLEGLLILLLTIPAVIPVLLFGALERHAEGIAYVFLLLDICVPIGLLVLHFQILPSRSNRFWRFAEATGILFMILVASSMFATAGASLAANISSSATRGVTVDKQVTVGSYEVTVLKATGPDELNGWLAANGFMSLPEKAADVVKDYIAKGWCFSAARLQRGEGGVSTPHPIRFDFAAKEAVYPMRLTALAGAPVALELYAVGDKEAKCDPLRREFCDVYGIEDALPNVYSSKGEWETRRVQMIATGRSFHQNFAHPDLVGVMWKGCAVTKLSGNVIPEQMNDDFRLSWKNAKPYRHHYYSARGARVTAAALLFFFAALFGSFCLFAAKRFICKRGKGWFFTRIVAGGSAVLIAGAFLAYLLLPKVDVRVMSWRMRDYFSLNTDVLKKAKIAADTSAEEVAAVLRDAVRLDDPDHTNNVFVGGAYARKYPPATTTLSVRTANGIW